MKPLLLLGAGFAIDIIWALSVLALQRNRKSLALLLAAVAPFLQFPATGAALVDEPLWGDRLLLTAFYATGSVLGLAVAMWFWNHEE